MIGTRRFSCLVFLSLCPLLKVYYNRQNLSITEMQNFNFFRAGSTTAATSKPTAPAGHADLKQTRRRLSVMSDNTLIEGIDHVNISEEPPVVRLTSKVVIAFC